MDACVHPCPCPFHNDPYEDPPLYSQCQAPLDWRDHISEEDLTRVVRNGESVKVIVLALDIRRSTGLMKESVNHREFADCMSLFINESRSHFRRTGGWFDKFTGDGFLGFWIVRKLSPEEAQVGGQVIMDEADYILAVATFVRATGLLWERDVLPRFMANCQNFDPNVGIGIGIDGGMATPTFIAGPPTMIGPPVVGAVRMGDAAKSGEILVNNRLGFAMTTEAEALARAGVFVTACDVKTKEGVQRAYSVRIDEDIAFQNPTVASQSTSS